MRKIIVGVFLLLTLFMVFSSASEMITNMPDNVDSFQEWRIKVLEANKDTGFLAIATSNYWGHCEMTCANLIFQGDCNPCAYGEVASMRGWHPDSMSVLDYWTSASSYCNDWLAPYNYYNQQAFCTVPSPECSGGADPGDKKCDGNEVWECSNSGVWQFSSDCDFGCFSGNCEDETCTDHSEKKCSGTSVYWFDSCGDQQEEYERCESDETCQGDTCVRECQESFIGEKLCSGSDVVQQYQFTDCTTEIRTVETCETGCENSVCISPECSSCPDPTDWSQCVDSSMFRTNYECSETTNYECSETTETESCECGTTAQCNYDEICEGNVCSPLECEEDEIADGHECIEIATFSTTTLVLIGVGVVLFFFILMIIIIMIMLKGGRNRNNNGKNKKRFR